MSIEHELLSSLDYDNVIVDFVNWKVKKRPLNIIFKIKMLIKNDKFILKCTLL